MISMRLSHLAALIAVLTSLIILLGLLVGDLYITNQRLNQEIEAHAARQFTCKTLLADPSTRRIMCAKH